MTSFIQTVLLDQNLLQVPKHLMSHSLCYLTQYMTTHSRPLSGLLWRHQFYFSSECFYILRGHLPCGVPCKILSVIDLCCSFTADTTTLKGMPRFAISSCAFARRSSLSRTFTKVSMPNVFRRCSIVSAYSLFKTFQGFSSRIWNFFCCSVSRSAPTQLAIVH